ncbi:AraC family transcriptional regulator [Hyphomicrobium nitrativorans NL23]|uniref:AraC family transcriptional regulator n=1 Tax=Hyphomicrobium nitrativorans NL23 TaxID=1029756 RepID=V5SC11_9HYPH|nr:AraC family transcriptional regulator [Hyphomicrobium nitrativorans NL23]
MTEWEIEREAASSVIYSTEGVHPRERLSYWREVATRGYVEHDVELMDGHSFNGTIEIASLPGLVLATYDADAATVRRSAKYAARADCDDVLLGLHLEGEVAISQDGRDSLISNRNFYLLDPLREFEVALKGRNKNLVIKIPRVQLEARLGQLGDLTACAIAKGHPVSTLAMGFVEMLPQQSKNLDSIASLNVAEQALDLIALALSTHQRIEGASLSSPRAVALLRLKATVERLLIEPGLKPERIATEAGISVRYANNLLAEEGSSIERYVNERRLQRCRRALEDTRQVHRSIGDIAFKWGFSDLSHFSRRFKTRFGMSPSDYRREAARLTGRTTLPPP